MIREIEIRNVKGQTAVQKLTGKDIIIGRNGSGKTTRMQAIGLAMLGYVPGKGKTAADTFKLASDNEMSVRMDTDAFGFERTYTKTSKLKSDGTMDVKIGQKLMVTPSMGESTNKQKEIRIQKELGDLPVMLDFGAFIALTDNQQRDFIYNLSGNAFSWNRERVNKELRESLLTPDLLDANMELYSFMLNNIEDTMAQYRDGIDVQAGILAMSEHAKDKLKYWKKEKITADGAAKKLTELKNRGEETDRDLKINMDNLKELQTKKEQLIKDIAEITSKNKIREDKEKQLSKLQEQIATMDETSESSIRDTLTSAIAELESAIEEGATISEQFERESTELQNRMAGLQEKLRLENEKLLAMKEELATINAEIKANGELLQRIQDSHGYCAFSPNIPCHQDFSEFINNTQGIMDHAYDRKDVIESNIGECTMAINGLQQEIQTVQEEQRKNDTSKKEHVKDITQKNKQLQKKNTELSELNNREPMIAAKKQQEVEIKAYLDENPLVDVTAMEDQKILVQGQIESLTVKIDEQKKVRNDLINIKANIIDSQTAEFNVLSWNQICKALGQGGIKGAIMKEMLNPLLDDVNKKLHEIGINEDFYFETNSDTGREIFEFGWSRKPFAALSTGEQLLLMTALMTTIIERANPPVKVLALDNVNDLDRVNLGIIMRGLNVIGKNMDNIILAGVVEPTEEDSEGWTIWRL